MEDSKQLPEGPGDVDTENLTDEGQAVNNTVQSSEVVEDESEHSDDKTPSTPLKETQNLPQSSGSVKPPATTQKVEGNKALHPQIPQLTVEQQLQKSKRDLESMVCNYAKSERENLINKNKVEELDRKLKRAIKDNDQLANRIKLLTHDKNQLTDTLNAKVAQLTVLEEKNSYLNNVQGVKLRQCEEKISKLESLNEDLVKQIESYKSKEGELLDFSERLSMKHMMLQSELEAAINKAPSFKEQYECVAQEKENLAKLCEELTSKTESLTECLKTEQERFEKHKTEEEEREVRYRASLDELQNEVKVTRRKHQNATRELIKEIKQLKSQLDKTAPSAAILSA